MSEAPLRALAPDLWVADRSLVVAPGQDIGTRMTVVRLSDGGLWLHSPVAPDEGLRRELDEIGPVGAIVAPARGHTLYVQAFREAYPDASVWVAPGLLKKCPHFAPADELNDAVPAPWSGVLEQHLVRGVPFMNEVVFLHPASRTLILTDLAFNVPERDRGNARLFYWLTGAVGRFGPHRIIRFAVRDKAATRRSIDRILEWDFERVTVTHGDVLEHGGPDALRRAFSYL